MCVTNRDCLLTKLSHYLNLSMLTTDSNTRGSLAQLGVPIPVDTGPHNDEAEDVDVAGAAPVSASPPVPPAQTPAAKAPACAV